jgi:hypothetical protein
LFAVEFEPCSTRALRLKYLRDLEPLRPEVTAAGKAFSGAAS